VKQSGGVRGFIATPLGRACLVALSAAILTLSIAFTGFVVAIPAFVIFGLGLPIYLGWKRPRQLAIAGLVALLIAAPAVSLIFTEEVREATPPVASPTETGIGGQTGSAIQNASVSPFTGDGGTTFTFSAEIFPQYFGAGENLTEVVLYVSTCQYNVTASSDPDCPGSIPLHYLNQTFAMAPTSVTWVYFNQSLGGTNIWYWTIGAGVRNTSTNQYTWVWVVPPYGYDAVPGPVSGDFAGTFGLLAPGIFAQTFLYPGLVYAVALLLYIFLKNREARRKGTRDPGMLPPPRPPLGTPSSGPGTPAPAPAAPAANERACPNCQAVIYPHEVRCWKCGTDLSAPGSDTARLPSSKLP
jgi:hypothetical protein